MRRMHALSADQWTTQWPTGGLTRVTSSPMFPEDSSGSPANSAENGVDFREVLYGSGRPGGPSGVGRVQQPYSEGGPLSPTRGPPSESSPPQGNWGINTSYGDWLLASSSASPKQPLLLERVQRVGEVQRLRDAASYRGPSGISQPRLQQQQQQQQQQPVLYSRSLRAEDSQRDNKAYLGAVGEGPYVGAREGGGPQCMQPSPSVYGLREQQRESMQRPLLDFSSPQDLRESNTDVYVLAPDSDTGMTENERDVLPLFADGGAPRSLRRRSFTTAAEGSGWGPPPAAEEGPLGGPLEGPLEGAPPFERLSPLDVHHHKNLQLVLIGQEECAGLMKESKIYLFFIGRRKRCLDSPWTSNSIAATSFQ
ncbi:hypothetical protein Emed_001540 [Eimeria media]